MSHQTVDISDAGLQSALRDFLKQKSSEVFVATYEKLSPTKLVFERTTKLPMPNGFFAPDRIFYILQYETGWSKSSTLNDIVWIGPTVAQWKQKLVTNHVEQFEEFVRSCEPRLSIDRRVATNVEELKQTPLFLASLSTPTAKREISAAVASKPLLEAFKAASLSPTPTSPPLGLSAVVACHSRTSSADNPIISPAEASVSSLRSRFEAAAQKQATPSVVSRPSVEPLKKTASFPGVFASSPSSFQKAAAAAAASPVNASSPGSLPSHLRENAARAFGGSVTPKSAVAGSLLTGSPPSRSPSSVSASLLDETGMSPKDPNRPSLTSSSNKQQKEAASALGAVDTLSESPHLRPSKLEHVMSPPTTASPKLVADRSPVSKEKTIKAKVLYAYQSASENELDLKEGDTVEVTDSITDPNGWWRGKIDGKEAYFPSNYVSVEKRE